MIALSTSALIFDFDGIILDTEYPEFISWQRIYSHYGFTLTAEKWIEYVGPGASTIDRTPYDDLDDLLGYSVDRAAVRTRRRTFFAELMTAAELLPGVHSLLATAKQYDIPLAIACSSPRAWVTGHLTRYDLLGYFDVIRCGDEVSRRKPDPELYLSALSALGIPSECAIALEDSSNGVAAAKAAGLYCIAIPTALTRLTSLSAADLQVTSLTELSLESPRLRLV